MRRRLLHLGAVSTFLVGQFVCAQISPERARTILSASVAERAQAFAALVGKNSELLDQIRSPIVDELLVELLVTEDEVVRKAFIEDDGASAKYGEGYAEYVAQLGEVVRRIVESRPELARGWEALLKHPYNPESEFARWLAGYADKAIPFLVQCAQANDPVYRKSDALLVLSQILEAQQADSVSPKNGQLSRVDKTRLDQIEELIRAGLTDQDLSVRWAAIQSLGRIGKPSDLELLERTARLDAQFVVSGGKSGRELRYPTREVAERALVALRKRLAATPAK